MAIPSQGYRSWIGLNREASWGETPAPRTQFLYIVSESVSQTIERIISTSLMGVSRRRWNPGAKTVAGSIEMEAQVIGLESLFKTAFGKVTTTQVNPSPAVYQHVFEIEDALPFSHCIEINRDLTVNSFLYTGCKINELGFTAELNDFLRLSFGITGKEEKQATKTASPSFTYADAFKYHQGALTIDGSSLGINRFALTIANGLSDRRFIGSEVQREQKRNSPIEVTGEITTELNEEAGYNSLAVYNKFIYGETARIELSFAGALITGSYYYLLKLTIGRAVFNGNTPNVAGPDIIPITLPFTAFYDIANAKAEVILTLINTTAGPIP